MILASKSPRRKEILSNFGINLEVKTKNIEEYSEKIKIEDQILDIACKKCELLAEENPNEYVLGADTVVVFGERILGKPKDEQEAYEILSLLSGKWHKVITAYCVKNISNTFVIKDYEITKVKFRDLSDANIKWYISTKDPMDKAGAYGIQGKGTFIVEKIEGDFYNVMGFPISRFIKILLDKGMDMEEILKL